MSFKTFCKRLPHNLEERCMNIPFPFILVFIIINTFLLFYLSHIILRIVFFIISLIILYFFGKLPVIDIDPVPFTTAVLNLFFGSSISIQYAVFTIFVADAITARFNQKSFFNLSALLVALFVMNSLNVSVFLSLVILLVVFNLIRVIIAFFMGTFQIEIVSTSINTIVYIIVTSVTLPLIELGVKVFV